MHDLGIVHEDFQMVCPQSNSYNCAHDLCAYRVLLKANILVDEHGTPHISGLGNVVALPNSEPRPFECMVDFRRLFNSCPPELSGGRTSRNPHPPTPRTKASDMYDFGVMACEVRTDATVGYYSVYSPKTGSYRTIPISRDGLEEPRGFHTKVQTTRTAGSPRGPRFTAGYD
jgi:serine/threonine protein kinase